ncbi:hypothetical protein NDU88_009723 [Pleurodeles waltl]|uniref:Uncharacterized protein n=1 Tax=Pleurodeles waltl TaxID=8319 RepID=A0AAV7PT94_PLEWA|nr:hypothetical protein NDU88_009723 [Pleurodeles waltl]
MVIVQEYVPACKGILKTKLSEIRQRCGENQFQYSTKPITVAPQPRARAAAAPLVETAVACGRATGEAAGRFKGHGTRDGPFLRPQEFHGKRGRTGDPESGHGPCRSARKI